MAFLCLFFLAALQDGVGSRGAVVSAALSERKVAGSIPTIGDFHTVGPCKKAVLYLLYLYGGLLEISCLSSMVSSMVPLANAS